jgi:hypothetical protein
MPGSEQSNPKQLPYCFALLPRGVVEMICWRTTGIIPRNAPYSRNQAARPTYCNSLPRSCGVTLASYFIVTCTAKSTPPVFRGMDS